MKRPRRYTGQTLDITARNAWDLNLRAFGRNLAADLLSNLRGALERPRLAGTRLYVESTETELPLELCFLRIGTQEVGLCDPSRRRYAPDVA